MKGVNGSVKFAQIVARVVRLSSYSEEWVCALRFFGEALVSFEESPTDSELAIGIQAVRFPRKCSGVSIP